MFSPDVIDFHVVILKHKQCFGVNVSVCVCVLQWVQPWSSSSQCAVWRRSSSCVCVFVSASASSVPTVSPNSLQATCTHLKWLNKMYLQFLLTCVEVSFNYSLIRSTWNSKNSSSVCSSCMQQGHAYALVVFKGVLGNALRWWQKI